MYASKGKRIRPTYNHKRNNKKLSWNIQNKWLKIVDSIEHNECRRAVFDDLVNFIQQEVCILSHPDYEYAKMTKKDTKEPKDIVKCRAVDKSDSEVKVNNNKEENEKQVKVIKINVLLERTIIIVK